jgi:hypothetical protein
MPLLAASYVSGSFFAADVTRLLLYALPLLVAFGLAAVFPLAATPEAPPSGRAGSASASVAGAVLTVAVVVAAPLALDRYRRADLRGARDGPLVLAVCRESYRMAQRLGAGRSVAFDAETTGYEWGVTPPEGMPRMRWFLREGWGPRAHYGRGDIVMQDVQASVLIPALRPQALEAALRLDAPSSRRLELLVNGRSLGDRVVDPGGGEVDVRLEAGALFRGDNVLTLSADMPGLHLRSLTLRPAP